MRSVLLFISLTVAVGCQQLYELSKNLFGSKSLAIAFISVWFGAFVFFVILVEHEIQLLRRRKE